FSDAAYAGRKFKDPVQYVYSSIRLLYPEQVRRNYRPLAGALQQLGEPVYGRQTPDGYGMRERDWASSDQLEKRFELARGFVGGRARLFVTKEAIDAGIDPSRLDRCGDREAVGRARGREAPRGDAARRLRRRQPARALRERFLLPFAPKHRRAASGLGRPERRGRPRFRLGAQCRGEGFAPPSI